MGRPSSMMSALRVTVMLKDRIRPCFTQSFTRSCRPAPRFWPMKLVMAAPRALLTAQKMPSVLPLMAQEATTMVPRELTPTWMIILDTAYMEDCSPEGMPRRSMFCR